MPKVKNPIRRNLSFSGTCNLKVKMKSRFYGAKKNTEYKTSSILYARFHFIGVSTSIDNGYPYFISDMSCEGICRFDICVINTTVALLKWMRQTEQHEQLIGDALRAVHVAVVCAVVAVVVVITVVVNVYFAIIASTSKSKLLVL